MWAEESTMKIKQLSKKKKKAKQPNQNQHPTPYQSIYRELENNSFKISDYLSEKAG